MSDLAEIQSRVDRERAAHTEDDVLARSYELKGRFPHVLTYPSHRRLNEAFERIGGDVKDKKVLDLGCGNGERSLQLLKAGAIVTGIDISSVYVAHAADEARKAGFDDGRFAFMEMDAHKLTFADGTFDLVVGEGILHHLDLKVSTDEINRVLKPQGRAVFKEPLEANPFLKVFRAMTPDARTEDERPLSPEDLRQFATNPRWKVESLYCGLLEAPMAVATSLALRPFPNNWLLSAADMCERSLANVGWLHPMHQYVLLNLVKI